MEKINLLFWIYKSKINAAGKAPVYFRISSPTGKFQLSTGVLVSPKEWDSKKQKVKGASAKSLLANTTLIAYKEKVEAAITEILQKKEDLTIAHLKQKLNPAMAPKGNLLELFLEHNNRILSLVGKTYSSTTHEIYEITRKEVQEFINLKFGTSDLALQDLKLEFIEELEVFYRLKKGNQTNTILKKFQRLNKVINVGIKRGFINANPLLTHKIKKEKKEIVFLTSDELKKVENLNTGIPRLELVRKLLLLSCYTGLAYRELYNLSESSLELGIDKTPWLRVYRQKTKKWIRIPLLPQASELIRQLTLNCGNLKKCNRESTQNSSKTSDSSTSKHSKLLKVPSNQKMNAYLKEIGVLAGIRKELHSHVGRKTFTVTVMLAAGVSLETISKLLGHSSIKITEDAYSQITDEKILSELRIKFKN